MNFSTSFGTMRAGYEVDEHTRNSARRTYRRWRKVHKMSRSDAADVASAFILHTTYGTYLPKKGVRHS